MVRFVRLAQFHIPTSVYNCAQYTAVHPFFQRLKWLSACPPEDCGGIYGYTDFLDAISNPDHPAHADMLE